MGSDKKPGRRDRRRAAADCRKGTHRFGSPRDIGAGMTRQTCFVCGAVSIDIRPAESPVGSVPVPPRYPRQ